jgi:two-component system, NarL family, nitrate/nitrite response regulator NarL
MDGQRTIRILLLDDHILFREGAARLLAAEPGFEVAGHCGTVEEALQKLSSTQVDLVLLDLDLGKERGFDFFAPARAQGFEGKILAVAAVVSPFEVRRLVNSGAAGIFLKQNSPALLTETIRGVMAGQLRIDPALEGSSPLVARQSPAELTDREQEVMKSVCEGLSNKEIAARVHISEALVKAILQQLFEKTGVRTRSQLVRIALEQYSRQI